MESVKRTTPIQWCGLVAFLWFVVPALTLAQETASSRAGPNSELSAEPSAEQAPNEWLETFDRLHTTKLDQAITNLNKVRATALATNDVDLLLAYAQRVIAHFRYTDDIPQIIEQIETFQGRNQARLTPEQSRYLQLVLAALHIQDQTDLAQAKRILTKLDQDPELARDRALIKKTLGDLYQTLGQYPEALTAYTEALRLDPEPAFRARVYNNLGNVASFLEDWDQAIDHYLKAIEVYDTLGYVTDQISVWANLGPSYRANGESEKALEVYLAGIEALEDLDSPDLKAQFQMNLGNLYVDLNQVDEALAALGQSIAICEQQGFTFCVMLNQLNMGYAHYINQDYANALAAYDLAAQNLENLPDPYVERQLMDNYSDLYRALGDYQKALDYADQYHALDRQLINAESKAAAEEIQTRYETELKDAELLIQAEQIQRQQTQLRLGVSLAAGLVLALAVVIFFLSFRAKTLQSLYERNQDLLTQNEVNQRLAQQRLTTEPVAVETDGAPLSLAQVFDRVTDALQRDAIYRDPNLSLNDLASHVASNSTYVSNAISQVANTNFNNLVNYYRIMDARRELNQAGAEAKISSLVHHCGFNSKASFYRAFSKYVGMTPSQYIQRLKANEPNTA